MTTHPLSVLVVPTVASLIADAQPIPPSNGLEKIHPAAINYAWEEAPMRMVLAIAALVSIAFD
jgi:hypothetical protein